MSNRYMFMLLRYVALLYDIKSRFPTCKTPFSWKKTTNVDEDEKNQEKKRERERKDILGIINFQGKRMTWDGQD